MASKLPSRASASEDQSNRSSTLPERLPAGGSVCPRCRKPALQFIEATSEFVCTNCGFKQPIKKV